MKYEVKLFYPEKLVEFETGKEIEHYEIEWRWENGPTIQGDHCIMRITDEDGQVGFSILSYSPDEKIDAERIIFQLIYKFRDEYKDEDVVCYGTEELTIGEVKDRIRCGFEESGWISKE